MAESGPRRKRALVTGSSRGIGAATAALLAAQGYDVAIHHRDPLKSRRAARVVDSVHEAGGRSFVVCADLTDFEDVHRLVGSIHSNWDNLDLLVLNASGGLEHNMAEGYAMQLNRDSQVRLLDLVMPLMPAGSRVVFVTSHQAHFYGTTPVHPEYESVARSKREGECALRRRIPILTERGIGFMVVSGDLIEGTVTSWLFNRIDPDDLESRRRATGRLYNVDEFAGEVVKAASGEIPAGNIRFVGNLSEFAQLPEGAG